MKYYKIKWDELRGDEYDSWGTSIWYLELNDQHYPLRQIEVYENGNRLKYNLENNNDSFGGLGDQPVDVHELNTYELSSNEFEKHWNIKSTIQTKN